MHGGPSSTGLILYRQPARAAGFFSAISTATGMDWWWVSARHHRRPEWAEGRAYGE